MFPELKQSLKRLIILILIGIFFIALWQNAEHKKNQREQQENKSGIYHQIKTNPQPYKGE